MRGFVAIAEKQQVAGTWGIYLGKRTKLAVGGAWHANTCGAVGHLDEAGAVQTVGRVATQAIRRADRLLGMGEYQRALHRHTRWRAGRGGHGHVVTGTPCQEQHEQRKKR